VWGKGYATEAGSRSVSYAFEVLAVDEVFSVILPDNVRSQGVAARLGFTLLEERVLSTFPEEAHGIWRIGRGRWQELTQRRLRPPSINTTSPVT
jgi:RimJ/RimL family protein N-acetyltransferase